MNQHPSTEAPKHPRTLEKGENHGEGFMFGAIYAIDGQSADTLLAVAREFSPRIEIYGPHEVILDLAGLTRLFGDLATIARELRRTAVERGLTVSVAIASSRTTARLLVRALVKGLLHESTAIASGSHAEAVAPLPIDLLIHIANVPNDSNDPNDLLLTFRRWGLRTVGDLAALPSDAVAARLGQEGVRWQRLARGEDGRPLVPAVPEERFEEAFDLEWPIEGLEPLAFVLGRLMESLSAHLERRGRGAAVLHIRLHLVTRTLHERSLQLPAPIRDARALRTLALLDLESNPPSAAIDRVVIAVDPTPGRVLQFSLLTRPLPSPEQLSTLMARLGALMGEGRCGSPVEVDSWQPGVFSMKAFMPRDQGSGVRDQGVLSSSDPRSLIPDPFIATAFRRFRFPVPARVRVENGKPFHVTTDRRGMTGGRIDVCAGPWRSSGAWWADGAGQAGRGGGWVNEADRTGDEGSRNQLTHPPHPPQWDRDEWDVTLIDGATYRVFRERDTGGWFIEGVFD